jgi:glucokinase
MAKEAIATGHAPELANAASSDPEFGAQSIYNLAMRGDEASRRIFLTFGRYLGIMLAGIVNILNLDMYVLGGGVVSAWDAYAPKMFEELRARSLVYAATAPDNLVANDPVTDDPLMTSRPEESGASLQQESSRVRKTIITRAQLGSDAGLYGAARVACLLS